MKNRTVIYRALSILILFATFLNISVSSQSSDEQDNTRPRRASTGGPRLTMAEIKSYEQSIDRLKKLLISVPYYFDGYCNIARVYALLGRKRDALSWLERAVDNGLIDSELIDTDAAFKSLQDEPAFKKIVAKSTEKGARAPKNSPPLILLTGPKNAASGKKLPLLITLHGESENALAIAELWRPVTDQNGFVLASPQGGVTIGEGHYQWGRRSDAEALVLEAIDRAREKYTIDPDRIYLMGFSQGGYLSLSIGLTRPDLFAGVIAVSPYYIHSLAAPSLEKARARKLRVYLGSGENEYPNILTNNREAKQLLEEAGLKVEQKLYRDTGHAFPANVRQELEQALKWVIAGE
jgi:phospholipase/carboxylesterase